MSRVENFIASRLRGSKIGKHREPEVLVVDNCV